MSFSSPNPLGDPGIHELFDIHIPAYVWFKAQLNIMDLQDSEVHEGHFSLPFSSTTDSRQDGILQIRWDGSSFEYCALKRPRSWIQPIDALGSILDDVG